MVGVTKKVLDLLRAAGGDGRSTRELADKTYGETSYTALFRIYTIIGGLRAKGFVIATVAVYAGARRLGKFVLYEKKQSDDSSKSNHTDEPSPRSQPDDLLKRGAR